jgi:hypothetical protein
MSVLQKTYTFFLHLFALIGVTFVIVFFLMRFDLLNVRGTIDARNEFFLGTTTPKELVYNCVDHSIEKCPWNESPEWAVVKGGLEKDAEVIARVAGETGVPARLIAAAVIPEQIRFFTSEREIFKRYFEPLKILGSLSQFSLGVSGIKQETAENIERFANDTSSPFYRDSKFAKLLQYEDTTPPLPEQLYNRLTDEKDHYYSYLYTAINLAQYLHQWKEAGYPIDDKPEILTTLFNLGHQKSEPKSTPSAGGAGISVGGSVYVFGQLGGLFYASDELTDIFPR